MQRSLYCNWWYGLQTLPSLEIKSQTDSSLLTHFSIKWRFNKQVLLYLNLTIADWQDYWIVQLKIGLALFWFIMYSVNVQLRLTHKRTFFAARQIHRWFKYFCQYLSLYILIKTLIDYLVYIIAWHYLIYTLLHEALLERT